MKNSRSSGGASTPGLAGMLQVGGGLADGPFRAAGPARRGPNGFTVSAAFWAPVRTPAPTVMFLRIRSAMRWGAPRAGSPGA